MNMNKSTLKDVLVNFENQVVKELHYTKAEIDSSFATKTFVKDEIAKITIDSSALGDIVAGVSQEYVDEQIAGINRNIYQMDKDCRYNLMTQAGRLDVRVDDVEAQLAVDMADTSARINGLYDKFDSYATKLYVAEQIKSAQLGLEGDSSCNCDLSQYMRKDEAHKEIGNTILIRALEVKEDLRQDLGNMIDSSFDAMADIYATREYVNTQINNAQLSGGDSSVDLSNYVTKIEFNQTLDAKNYASKEYVENRLKDLDDSSSFEEFFNVDFNEILAACK